RILGLRRRGVRGLTVIRFSARRARCGGTGLRILIGLEGLTAAVAEDAGLGGDPRMISLGDGVVLQRGVVDAAADALPGVEFDRITGFDGLAESVSCGEARRRRSEEHTSELQSRFDLVCRLLLEKKNYLIAPSQQIQSRLQLYSH